MEISNDIPRKIAYIITLPDLGGAQSHVCEVIRNIGKYGYAPILITGKEGWLTEQAIAEGIPCYNVPDLVRPIAPLHDFKAVRAVKKILQQEQPVLVHCHSSKAGIIGRVAAHICNIPAIFTAHGWAFTDGVNPIKRKVYAFIENIAAYWTDQIICVSEYDRNLGIRYLPKHKEKIVTIHNCIPDIPQFVRDWKKNPFDDVLNIVVVARFSPPKKNIEILHQMRKILDSGLKITVTFIGDGPQLEMTKAEAKRIRVEKEAIFLGARTDVETLLMKFDVFLLLSNWEGFPVSIIEAMRAGLPIIASDVGGVRESVNNNETGWLIDRENANFYSIIRNIIHEPNALVVAGMNSRKRYLREFTIDKMMKKMDGVYNLSISGVYGGTNIDGND